MKDFLLNFGWHMTHGIEALFPGYMQGSKEIADSVGETVDKIKTAATAASSWGKWVLLGLAALLLIILLRR